MLARFQLSLAHFCSFATNLTLRGPITPAALPPIHCVSAVAVRVWASSRITSATWVLCTETGAWENECNYRDVSGLSHSPSIPNKPTSTIAYCSVALPPKLRVISPSARGPATGIHARLPLPCQNQRPATPACKFSPNFRETPGPDSPADQAQGNCTNLAVQDKWVSHSGSTSLIAARWTLVPPKGRRFC